MVLRNDFDGLVDLGRAQVEEGAHCLDVCVATTERSDELEFMITLVKRLSLEIDAPLVIDSTDPKVIEASLKQIPGKPIINSINLEDDGTKFHSLSSFDVEVWCSSCCYVYRPKRNGQDPARKTRNSRHLLFETGKRYDLQPWQFIFDVLTFTLATRRTRILGFCKIHA